MERAAIIGIGMTDVGIFPDSTPQELAIEAIRSSIADAGVDKGAIQALINTPIGYLVESDKFAVQRMAEYLEIPTRVMAEVDCGGSSSLVALKQLVNEIKLGNIDMGLVYASHWELTTKEMLASFPDTMHLARSANNSYGSYDSRYGMLSPLAYYAMSTQRYMYECDVAPELIAEVPVVLRDNAGKNPRAMYKKPITVKDVLESQMLSPPIHLLESCPLSHGAAAIVVASETRARDITDKFILISGIGESHDDSHFVPARGDISVFPCVRKSVELALYEAGRDISGIDITEVYGAFAGVECMTYEDLGFFPRGEAPRAVAEGRTRIDGETPINTSGGRLSLGHASYATPLFEVFEVVLQLRGECGERQVKDPRVGLVQAEHGMINGSVVIVLERSW